MQKNHLFVLSAASLMLMTSCAKLGKLSADNFNVVPNPLETQAGKVPATINGMFPEKYLKRKAVVTVVPELRYGNGKVATGTAATFQGEKVEGNDQTISYLLGGHYTMKTNFDYVPEMQKSDMYLTFDARIGKKKVNVPAIKVATGIIATSELAKRTLESATACIAPDSFQRVREHKYNANIKFLIQQATIRKSELKNNSVKEFINLLQKISKDKEGLNLGSVEVSAYASPDGGLKLNEKLANQRQNVSEGYIKSQMKSTKIDAPIDANYTAQDWEGFQELVKASDIQDKDVILRVLSMYTDPEEREQQIKNMSAGFRELADAILPELRRARLTINYETIGRDDDQIISQLATDAKQLSVEELLYAATLKETPDEQEAIYKQTTDIYPDDARAYNNIATIEYAKGNYAAAKEYINKAQQMSSNTPETYANMGLLALKANDIAGAENYIGKAAGANGLEEILGNLHLAQGNYAQAVQDFNHVNSNSAVLAFILNKDYAKAATALKGIKTPNGMTDYLKAILMSRQGNKTEAATALRNAINKDASLATYAAKDLELVNINK